MDKAFKDAFYIGYCFALRKVGFAIDTVRNSQRTVCRDYEDFIHMCKIFGEEGERRADEEGE